MKSVYFFVLFYSLILVLVYLASIFSFLYSILMVKLNFTNQKVLIIDIMTLI